ncbi:MAG: ABC transporter substrate-binding protein [Gemmatimonadota bacterium]|nr:ABC transporter substrate-binding protein [Gemmatimonadota bacterium]
MNAWRSAFAGRLLFAALMSSAVVGCAPSSSTGESGILTVTQSTVVIGDPHIVSDGLAARSIIKTIYDALVEWDADGNYQPALAERWEVSDDARTWTFYLRDGVTFHNGEVLRASDVVATMGRVLDPSIGGAFGTEGVYASYLGTAQISAVDDRTVRIVTEDPMADLLDLVVDMPISPESELMALPDSYVGSGPYRIVEHSEARLVTAAHDGHWRGTPTYADIYWGAEADAEARVSAVLNGRAHLAAGIGISGRDRIEADGGASAYEMNSALAIIFMLNAFEGPTADARVRQALNLALDRNAIIADIVEGAAQPLSGYLTPGHFGYNPQTLPYPYDPDRARALLAEAGYPEGLTLSFDIPQVMPDEMPELSRRMVDQYRDVGITLEIVEHEDRSGYSQMVRRKEIANGAGFDSSPWSTYRVLREKIHSELQGPWWEGYENPEVDALIEEAQGMVSVSDRQAIYRRIYQIVRDDAPWIFLYNPTLYWGVAEGVEWMPRVDGLMVFR